MKSSDYKELKVWQKAVDLTIAVYDIAKCLPKEELYALSDQMKRAAVSVPSNIAEGHGRNSQQDFIRFLNISRGSLYEIETQLVISERMGYVTSDTNSKAKALIIEISKMINAFIAYLLHPKQKANN